MSWDVQPHTHFHLLTTLYPETFEFKIKTTYPGNGAGDGPTPGDPGPNDNPYYHLSAAIRVTIVCNNNYMLFVHH